MKINNKGFAISSIMYMILVLAIIIIVVTLSVLSSRGIVLEKIKKEALVDVYKKQPLSRYLKKLFKQTTTATVNTIEYSLDETHGLMYDRLGGTTTSLTDGNLRYYGANPNNYIDIGDRDSNGNIIFWRIIGVFKDITVVNDDETTRTQDLVKIIRADNISDGTTSTFSWDSNSNQNSNDNNWTNASLMKMLNDEKQGYYVSTPTYGYNNSTIYVKVDLSSAGLSSAVHEKIQTVEWDIGGNTSNVLYANDFYISERTPDAPVWTGKIALMNASDYGYATDLTTCALTMDSYGTSGCYNNDWLQNGTIQWTLTNYPTTGSNDKMVFFVYSSGAFYYYHRNHQNVVDCGGVRPTMYLKPEVAMVGKETAIINGIETSYYIAE